MLASHAIHALANGRLNQLSQRVGQGFKHIMVQPVPKLRVHPAVRTRAAVHTMRRQQLFGHNGNSRAPFIFLRPVVAIADDLEVIAEILNHVAELEALKKSAVPQGITHKSQALNGHGLLAEAQFLDLLRGQKRGLQGTQAYQYRYAVPSDRK